MAGCFGGCFKWTICSDFEVAVPEAAEAAVSSFMRELTLRID